LFRGFETRVATDELRASQIIQSVARMNEARQLFVSLKNAVVDIQSLWRRKEAVDELNFVQGLVVLQSAWKSVDAKHLFDENRNSSILLQSVGRMNQTKSIFDEEKQATLKMQSIFRGLEARVVADELRAAQALQSTFRMTVDRDAFLQTKESATCFQSFWRSLEARNELKFRQSVMKLQSSYKAVDAHEQFQEIKTSAICVQSLGRMVLDQDTFEAEKNQQSNFNLYFEDMNLDALLNKFEQLEPSNLFPECPLTKANFWT
jgi:myosin heavy subunit